MNAIRHRFQIALPERPLLAFLRQENQERVAVGLVHGDEVVAPGLDASHIQDQVRQDCPDLFVNRCAVVVLDRGQVGCIHVEKCERAVVHEHAVDRLRVVTIAGHLSSLSGGSRDGDWRGADFADHGGTEIPVGSIHGGRVVRRVTRGRRRRLGFVQGFFHR